MYLSEYFLRSVVEASYNPGMEILSVDAPFSTTAINDIFLGRMTKFGWEKHQPCKLKVSIVGDMPHFYITQKYGLHADAKLGLNVRCKKHENATEYSQVFTALTKKIEFTGDVTVEKDFKVKIHLRDFKLALDKFVDS